jgi:serine/threonine protein kinase
MAVLSDFGIAKNLEDKTQLTAAGWRLGTPNYMSPEQALANRWIHAAICTAWALCFTRC